MFVLDWWINDFVSIIARGKATQGITYRLRASMFEAIRPGRPRRPREAGQRPAGDRARGPDGPHAHGALKWANGRREERHRFLRVAVIYGPLCTRFRFSGFVGLCVRVRSGVGSEGVHIGRHARTHVVNVAVDGTCVLWLRNSNLHVKSGNSSNATARSERGGGVSCRVSDIPPRPPRSGSAALSHGA